MRSHDRNSLQGLLDQFATLVCRFVYILTSPEYRSAEHQTSVPVSSDNKGFFSIPWANLSDKTKLLKTESLSAGYFISELILGKFSFQCSFGVRRSY